MWLGFFRARSKPAADANLEFVGTKTRHKDLLSSRALMSGLDPGTISQSCSACSDESVCENNCPMNELHLIPADIASPGSLIVVGGAILLVLGGLILSLAVLVAAVIRRK